MITGFYDDQGIQISVTKRSVFCAVMADLHPQLGRFACVVSPGDTDDVITSPYNAALALEKLHQYATCVLPLCNDSLTKVRKLRSLRKPVKLFCIYCRQTMTVQCNAYMHRTVSGLIEKALTIWGRLCELCLEGPTITAF